MNDPGGVVEDGPLWGIPSRSTDIADKYTCMDARRYVQSRGDDASLWDIGIGIGRLRIDAYFLVCLAVRCEFSGGF